MAIENVDLERNKVPDTSLRVLVLQNGARHRYAIPAVLERAGLLAAFYTDVAGNVGLGKLMSKGQFLPFLGRPLRRLSARQVPRNVRTKTISFPIASVFSDSLMRRQMLRVGIRNANLVYSSLGWGRPLLEEARRRRIPVVTEMYVRPSLWRTYQEEYRAFSDWEEEMPFADHQNEIGGPRDPCAVSDYVIVPAESVRDDVIREHGFPSDRIFVVPYAASSEFLEIQNEPIVARVLFAGSCRLGKGIHYLAMAADILRTGNARAQYEFRAAGNVSRRVCDQPIARHLKFLGRIPRDAMITEYRRADVFVLPSLSESSAGVTYEALAAGVPVITTPEAGSVVRDGIEGRIVPARDVESLAGAITEIVEDRPKRERMAAAARERAREFTWERYGERLIYCLKGLNAVASAAP